MLTGVIKANIVSVLLNDTAWPWGRGHQTATVEGKYNPFISLRNSPLSQIAGLNDQMTMKVNVFYKCPDQNSDL